MVKTPTEEKTGADSLARPGSREQTAATGGNQTATDQPTMPTKLRLVPDGARRGFTFCMQFRRRWLKNSSLQAYREVQIEAIPPGG